MFIKPPWTLADLLQLFDKYVIKLIECKSAVNLCLQKIGEVMFT